MCCIKIPDKNYYSTTTAAAATTTVHISIIWRNHFGGWGRGTFDPPLRNKFHFGESWR